jgi:GntR family transcriptional regulator/MocR family aminotransferase
MLHRAVAARAGLECVPVGVDDDGMRVELLPDMDAGAVLVTPAHQSPTGAVLAPERRRSLLAWAERASAVVIEDDYDAEFRYDREPVGPLQGLAPERVVYCGSASKTLAPAMRLGWLVLPDALADAVAGEKALDDMGSPVLEQLALADFLEAGELDRHLRRMRPRYRARRVALVEALARELPEVELAGVAAGLAVVALLPRGSDERALATAAAQRGVAVHPLGFSRFDPASGPPGLVLGYASMPEPALARGVAEVAAAWRELQSARAA